MSTPKTDVSHIRACHNAWYQHLATCERCTDHMLVYDCGLCETGQVAWDEWAAAISANPSCESVEATLPNDKLL